MTGWIKLRNVRAYWNVLYGLGLVFELEDWYSPEQDNYQKAVVFKLTLVCLLVTGNIYYGPPRARQ